ncbi:15981_t:CDS:2, partial [Dentiscutata heterogama]
AHSTNTSVSNDVVHYGIGSSEQAAGGHGAVGGIAGPNVKQKIQTTKKTTDHQVTQIPISS